MRKKPDAKMALAGSLEIIYAFSPIYTGVVSYQIKSNPNFGNLSAKLNTKIEVAYLYEYTVYRLGPEGASREFTDMQAATCVAMNSLLVQQKLISTVSAIFGFLASRIGKKANQQAIEVLLSAIRFTQIRPRGSHSLTI
jgi:hypothetical protein